MEQMHINSDWGDRHHVDSPCWRVGVPHFPIKFLFFKFSLQCPGISILWTIFNIYFHTEILLFISPKFSGILVSVFQRFYIKKKSFYIERKFFELSVIIKQWGIENMQGGLRYGGWEEGIYNPSPRKRAIHEFMTENEFTQTFRI